MSKNSISGKIKKNHDWNRHGLQDLSVDGRAQAMRPSTDKLEGICVRWEVRLSQTQSTHRVEMTTFCHAFHHDGKTSPAWRGWMVYTVTPTPFTISTITGSVCSSWERRYIPPFSTLPLWNLWSQHWSIGDCTHDFLCKFASRSTTIVFYHRLTQDATMFNCTKLEKYAETRGDQKKLYTVHYK